MEDKQKEELLNDIERPLVEYKNYILCSDEIGFILEVIDKLLTK